MRKLRDEMEDRYEVHVDYNEKDNKWDRPGWRRLAISGKRGDFIRSIKEAEKIVDGFRKTNKEIEDENDWAFKIVKVSFEDMYFYSWK